MRRMIAAAALAAVLGFGCEFNSQQPPRYQGNTVGQEEPITESLGGQVSPSRANPPPGSGGGGRLTGVGGSGMGGFDDDPGQIQSGGIQPINSMPPTGEDLKQALQQQVDQPPQEQPPGAAQGPLRQVTEERGQTR